MELIDTHAHLTFDGLIENIDDVIEKASAAGVSKIITIATEPEDFEKVELLGGKYQNIYTAFGIHPHHAQEAFDEHIEQIGKLCTGEKCAAIGETGLDYHYNFSKQDAQKWLFRQHLDIAAKFSKPVIVHSRNAFDETLEILDEYKDVLKKIVFHCFSGDENQSAELVKRGYYISYTGVITFKNAEIGRRGVLAVPLERMMLETDCPYMAPEPMRRQKINEPALMVHTARFIAQLKGVEFEHFCSKIAETTKEFFGV